MWHYGISPDLQLYFGGKNEGAASLFKFAEQDAISLLYMMFLYCLHLGYWAQFTATELADFMVYRGKSGESREKVIGCFGRVMQSFINTGLIAREGSRYHFTPELIDALFYIGEHFY
jgi:hypothetical protein